MKRAPLSEEEGSFATPQADTAASKAAAVSEADTAAGTEAAADTAAALRTVAALRTDGEAGTGMAGIQGGAAGSTAVRRTEAVAHHEDERSRRVRVRFVE
jgi:hypothetical protein